MISAIRQRYHLLIVDLHPPSRYHPQGIHGAIWSELGEPEYEAPEEAPLTLAAYAAGEITRAYVEPTAIGRAVADMPLFLTPDRYVRAPLDATYMAAWRGIPSAGEKSLLREINHGK